MKPYVDPDWAFRILRDTSDVPKAYRRRRRMLSKPKVSLHDSANELLPLFLHMGGSRAPDREISLLITQTAGGSHLTRTYRGSRLVTGDWLCAAFIYGVLWPVHRGTCKAPLFSTTKKSCVRWIPGVPPSSCCFAPRLFEGLVMASVPEDIEEEVGCNGGTCVSSMNRPDVTHVISETMISPSPCVPVVTSEWLRVSMRVCDLMREECFVPGRGGAVISF